MLSFFPGNLLVTSFKFSIFQTFLDKPLNTKKVPHNIAGLLPKSGIFGGHRFWIMNFDSRPPNLRHDFMHTRFEFRHIFAPCANGYPKFYPHKDQT
jgi:hypothetical protein